MPTFTENTIFSDFMLDVGLQTIGLTVDEIANHDTNGHHDLEQTSDATSYVLRWTLRDVGGRHCWNATNTDSRNHPTAVNVSKPSAGSPRNCLKYLNARQGTIIRRKQDTYCSKSKDYTEDDKSKLSSDARW